MIEPCSRNPIQVLNIIIIKMYLDYLMPYTSTRSKNYFINFR